MANKKLILVAALAAIVLLALFLFTRSGMQPDVRPHHRVAAHQPGAHPHRAKRGKRLTKEQRRANFLKRWEKMTPEQKERFRKRHPKAKLPPEEPVPAPAPATPPAAPAKK